MVTRLDRFIDSIRVAFIGLVGTSVKFARKTTSARPRKRSVPARECRVAETIVSTAGRYENRRTSGGRTKYDTEITWKRYGSVQEAEEPRLSSSRKRERRLSDVRAFGRSTGKSAE